MILIPREQVLFCISSFTLAYHPATHPLHARFRPGRQQAPESTSSPASSSQAADARAPLQPCPPTNNARHWARHPRHLPLDTAVESGSPGPSRRSEHRPSRERTQGRRSARARCRRPSGPSGRLPEAHGCRSLLATGLAGRRGGCRRLRGPRRGVFGGRGGL